MMVRKKRKTKTEVEPAPATEAGADAPLTAAELDDLSTHDGPTVGPASDDVAAQDVGAGLEPEPEVEAGASNGQALAIPWGDVLRPVLTQCSGLLETRAPLWCMTAQEIDGLSMAWGSVLDKYVPDASMGPEALALLATVAYVLPRYLTLADSGAAVEERTSKGEEVGCADCGETFPSEFEWENHSCPASRG
jgi:hypothetical protein